MNPNSVEQSQLGSFRAHQRHDSRHTNPIPTYNHGHLQVDRAPSGDKFNGTNMSSMSLNKFNNFANLSSFANANEENEICT